MGELILNSCNSDVGRTLINKAFSGTANFSTIKTNILSSPPITLTDDATIYWDYSTGCTAQVTLTDNRLLLVYNAPNGSYGTLKVTQDAVGSRTLTFTGGIPLVVSGGSGSITLTSTANAVDILTFYYDGASFYWNVENNFT